MIGSGKVDILYIVYPQFIFIKTFLNVKAGISRMLAAYEFTILELLPLVMKRPGFSLESHLTSLPKGKLAQQLHVLAQSVNTMKRRL